MLTDRQRATLRFLHEYHARNGFAPKLSQIAQAIGIRSKGVVHRYLQAIAAEGLIELVPRRHRGIRLIGDYPESPATELTLPLVGKIAAGQPIEAVPDQNTFDPSMFFLGPDRFVLKVQGDSMIEAGILDGDMIIVEQCDLVEAGDIVVALIDNDEATLKRLQENKDGTITLIPANQAMRPMSYSAERIQIQGVVIGQMRCYCTGKLRRTVNR